MDTVIDPGKEAPDFELPDLAGKMHTLKRYKGRIVVMNFWSAECVWSERVDHDLMGAMDAWNETVTILWIAANANEPRELIENTVSQRKLPIVLIDADQRIADLYGAQVTPHMFVVDASGKLAYQGAWNDITFRQRVATQYYVTQVVEALRHGMPPPVMQTQAYGCALVRQIE